MIRQELVEEEKWVSKEKFNKRCDCRGDWNNGFHNISTFEKHIVRCIFRNTFPLLFVDGYKNKIQIHFCPGDIRRRSDKLHFFQFLNTTKRDIRAILSTFKLSSTN
jgi:hypothetical protein